MTRILEGFAVAGVALALVSGCTSAIAGVAGPAGSPAASDYVAPTDGSGFSTKPVDQLQPLPALDDPHGCDFLAQWQSQLSALGAIETAPVGSGCEFILPDNEYVQIHLAGPYEKLVDQASMLKPTTLDGLDGRYYALTGAGSTLCSIELNTRSLYDIALDAWNENDKAGSQGAHCKTVTKYADALVRKYVPLAGGTPWPGTVQEPSPDQLAGAGPCTMVGSGAAYFANDLEDTAPKQSTSPQGNTCKYQGAVGTVEVLLTDTRSGLTTLAPQAAGARTSTGKLGVMPIRVDSAQTSCGVAAQLVTGQVLEVTLTPTVGNPAETCLLAHTVLAVGLMNAISHVGRA